MNECTKRKLNENENTHESCMNTFKNKVETCAKSNHSMHTQLINCKKTNVELKETVKFGPSAIKGKNSDVLSKEQILKLNVLKRIRDVERKLENANIVSNTQLVATKEALNSLTEAQDELKKESVSNKMMRKELNNFKLQHPMHFDKVTQGKVGGNLGLSWHNNVTQFIFEMLGVSVTDRLVTQMHQW